MAELKPKRCVACGVHICWKAHKHSGLCEHCFPKIMRSGPKIGVV